MAKLKLNKVFFIWTAVRPYSMYTASTALGTR